MEYKILSKGVSEFANVEWSLTLFSHFSSRIDIITVTFHSVMCKPLMKTFVVAQMFAYSAIDARQGLFCLY